MEDSVPRPKVEEKPQSVRAVPVDSSLPRYFSVPLRHPAPSAAIIIISAGFVLSFAAFAAIPVLIGSFAAPEQVKFLMTYVWGAVPLLLLISPVLVLTAMGWILPATLEVDNGRLYRQGFFFRRELTDRIAALRQVLADNCWVLYDKNQKPLAKFDGTTPEGSKLLNYLYRYHIDWVRERPQKGNETDV